MKMSVYKICLLIGMLSMFNIAEAQQFIGGVYYQDLTLTKENSPYIVTENLITAEGVHLAIEKDVEVLFEQDAGFRIKGSVEINGTAAEPVVFDVREATSEQWGGITLLEQSDQDTIPDIFNYALFTRSSGSVITTYNRDDLIIENCNFFNNSSYTIKLISSRNTIVRNNHLSYGSFGIYISSRAKTENVLLQNNVIDNFFSVGILILGQDALTARNMFRDNVISNCLYGIQIAGGEKTYSNTFQNNQLLYNEVGFFIYNGYNYLFNNVIFNNNYGVRFQGNQFSGGDENSLLGNLIFNNNDAVKFEEHCIHNTLESNRVLFNTRGLTLSQVSVQESGGNTVINNIFENNIEYDIRLHASPQDSIAYNSFASGDSLNFQLLDEFDQTAAYNWWGTSDTVIIENKIYDQLDDQELGRVLYQPVLDEPLNNMPPEPENVSKRLAYDSVIVSWDSVEAGIAGYRVYYNRLNTFQFEEVYEVTDANSFAIPGANIHAEIAVTTINDQANGNNDQQNMNESWFSFASMYPFAGNDTTICQGEVLEFIHATAFDYDSLLWISNGQGVLSDEDKLKANYLYDQQELEDQVVFKLHQYNDGILKEDSIKVEFVSLPEVFAGNDTIILVDSVLRTNQAVADYVDSVKWESTGDGYFENADSLTSLYHPGDEDIASGNLELIMSAYSHCGQYADTLMLTIRASFSISGSVMHDNTARGSIQLLAENSEDFRFMTEAVPDVNNEFFLPAVPEMETYLLYVPDKNSGYLPTYYVNKTRWENAYKIDIKADVHDMDIKLQKPGFILPLGQASIRGVINVSEPSGNIKPIVHLTDSSGRVLKWNIPNQNGFYSFNDIPYGNYRIGTEKAGVPYFLTALLTLTPDNQHEEIVNISIDGKNVKAEIQNQSHAAEVFPVLAEGKVNLRFNRDANSIMLRWLTLTGTNIRTQNLKNSKAGEIIELDIQDFTAGMYILEIRFANNNIQTKKILKQ